MQKKKKKSLLIAYVKKEEYAVSPNGKCHCMVQIFSECWF